MDTSILRTQLGERFFQVVPSALREISKELHVANNLKALEMKENGIPIELINEAMEGKK